MLRVPQALIEKYVWLLINREAQPKEYPAYRKWLRYNIFILRICVHKIALVSL